MKYKTTIQILISTLLLCISAVNLQSQSFTTWQAGPSSDYYATYVWNAGTNFGCDCYQGARDRFILYETSVQQAYSGASRPHESGSYSGSNAFPIGPSSSLSLRAQMQIVDATNNDFAAGNCSVQCSASFGPNPNAALTVTTEPVRPPGNMTMTSNFNESVTFTWTVDTDLPESEYLLRYEINGSIVQNFGSKSQVTVTRACAEIGTHSFYTLRNIPPFNEQSEKVSFQVTEGPISDGQISGTIKTKSGTPVQGVIVKATIQNPQDFSNCLSTLSYESAPSLQTGAFTIPNIRYISDATTPAIYKVEAFLDGHQFRYPNANSPDSTIEYPITPSNHSYNDANFIDITSFNISGQVTSSINGCPLSGVEISEAPGGNSGIFPVTTDQNGFYNLNVPEGNKSYSIKARYRPGSITDSIKSVFVGSGDVINNNYIHTETKSITGFLGAGCQEYIGTATIEFKTADNDCVVASVNTNNSGFYSITLPVRPLTADITSFTADPNSGITDEAEVLSGIGSPVNFDPDSLNTLNFTYGRPLTVSVSGFPAPSCSAIPFPIVEQGKEYTIFLAIKENGTCPIDTGKVKIFNNISGSTIQGQILDSVTISNGVASYILKPGDPNFIGDNLKNITFQAIAGTEVALTTVEAIVTGAVKSGNNFTTTAPTELPFLILRDPPGDMSYSEFIAENTTTISQTYSNLLGGGAKVWANAKVGVDIFGAEIWGQVGASFEVNSSKSTTDEFILEITNENYFKTSENDNIIGEAGDVFVGLAMNFIYATARELLFDINTCAVEIDTALLLNGDGFATTFLYTENHISNNIIPTRKLIAANTTLEDSVRHRAKNDVKLWEEVLQLNRDLKEEALVNAQNFSWDGGAPFGQSTTISKSGTKTIEFVTQIDVEVAAEAGFEFSNNGASAGVDVKFQTTIGEVRSSSENTTTTTKYFITDSNLDNSMSGDIAVDPVFGTPVFKVLAGQTSCPWEPNTVRLDEFTMIAVNPVIEVASGNEAEFTLEITNTRAEGAPRNYSLDLNPFTGNAEVLFENNTVSWPIDINSVGPGQTKTAKVQVRRSPTSSDYEFEGIELYLYPSCNDTYVLADLVSTVTLSAYFPSPCSNIDMSAPFDKWSIGKDDNNELLVTMSGYDLSNNFDNVIMQYKEDSVSGWSTSNINKTKAELLVGSTTTAWDVSNLTDGNYSIRFILNCGSIKSISNRTSGTIDRGAPEVYGIEKPANDVYFPEKEISVEFNEALNCAVLNSTDVYLMKVPQMELVPATFECSGNEIIVIPSEDISLLYNQVFEVGIKNVTDKMSNTREDTVIWDFRIGEPDTDRDGVPDTKDRCPGGDDLKDSDLGGLPDDCDCLPFDGANDKVRLTNYDNNALHFDGGDDFAAVTTSTLPFLNETASFTLEAWIKPASGSSTYPIISKAAGYQFSIIQDKISLFIGETNSAGTMILANTNITFDIWTHVAVTYNAEDQQFTFYLNGEEDGTGSINHNFYQDPNVLIIGYSFDGCNCTFNGAIDEVRIWSKYRSSREIKGFLNQELKGIEKGLTAYYDFNVGDPGGDNSGLISIPDLSRSKLDITLFDFAKTGASSNLVKSDVDLIAIKNEPLTTCLPCTGVDTTNTALDFDGVDDRIFIANQPELIPSSSNAITIEAWLNPSSDGTQKTIISSTLSNVTNFVLLLDNSKIWLIHGGFHLGNTVIFSEEWTHIAVVFNLSTVSFYVNGQLDAVHTLSNTSYNATPPIYIGYTQGQPWNYKGKIDDLRISNYAKSQQDIIRDYEREAGGAAANVVASYSFNEGLPSMNNTGISTLVDESGNAHSGTLENFAKTGSSSNWIESPRIFSDGDKDGITDFCDPCFASKKLVLDNAAVNGIYRATEEITLGPGVTIPNNANIFYRAPIVKINEAIDLPAGALITILKDPCDL